MSDIINVEILEDGTLKMTTDKISMPNHAGAEALFREIITAMGGKAERVRRGAHSHSHTHEHTHKQEG
jgi:hypothetical protein